MPILVSVYQANMTILATPLAQVQCEELPAQESHGSLKPPPIHSSARKALPDISCIFFLEEYNKHIFCLF